MAIDPGDELARLAPYLEDMAEACLAMGEGHDRDGLVLDVPLLAAVALRETKAGWGRGYYPQGDPNGFGDDADGAAGPAPAYGRGIFQIDRRGPYRGLVPDDGDPWPVFDQALAALTALRDARHELRHWLGHQLYERAVVAAYNAGSPRVAKALRAGLDPDSVTTAGPTRRPDYGADVLARRAALRARYPDTFPPAGGLRRQA